MMLAVDLTFYFPMVMAAVFLGFLFAIEMPAKGRFFARALVALLIALLLAHLNRIFDFWPEYRYFASGHMTFSLGLAISLGIMRPWTLWITLPVMVPFGVALVAFHFHSVEDVLGAIVIVSCVYGSLERVWGLSPTAIAAKPVMQAAVVRGK
jgi:hypothetical protein